MSALADRALEAPFRRRRVEALISLAMLVSLGCESVSRDFEAAGVRDASVPANEEEDDSCPSGECDVGDDDTAMANGGAAPDTPSLDDDDTPVGCAQGTTRACSEAGLLGACARGFQTCEAGAWGACSIQPVAADRCTRGDDGNCDGEPNQGCVCIEGDVQPCSASGYDGTCAEGEQRCGDDGEWADCSVQPTVADSCEAGNDDNCNGVANEGCPCTEDDERPCSQGGYDGACASGVQVCRANEWSECSVVPAAVDTCEPDNDDDCNGVANEGCECVVGEAECVGGAPSTQRRSCTSEGTWGAVSDCPGLCSGAGECSGDCTPGVRECRNDVPYECNSDAVWQAEAACPAAMPCQGPGICRACDSGSFASVGQCVPWTSCQPGEYVSSAGTSAADRRCSACASGTFSITANSAGCTSWTACPAGNSEGTAGTATRDRVCVSTVGPSCDALAASCGAARDAFCCESLQVPGDTFNRNNFADYRGTVSDVELDQFEVTVGRFRNFSAAWADGWRPGSGDGKHTHLNGGNGLLDISQPGTVYETGWVSSWTNQVDPMDPSCGSSVDTWTPTPADNEDRPINCVNWYEALAFCIWDGGFLPSETEWLNAYHGGGDGSGQREFPWSVPSSSTTISPAFASYWVDETQQCQGDGMADCTLDDILVVGSKPDGNGRFGHSDLSGNMGEWMLDGYVDSATAFEGDCVDCAYLNQAAPTRVLQGGAFSSTVDLVSHWYRLNSQPSARHYIAGIRCARPPS